jgi:hypothetical protein
VFHSRADFFISCLVEAAFKSCSTEQGPRVSNPRIGTDQSIRIRYALHAEAHGKKARTKTFASLTTQPELVEALVRGGKFHLQGVRFKTEQRFSRKTRPRHARNLADKPLASDSIRTTSTPLSAQGGAMRPIPAAREVISQAIQELDANLAGKKSAVKPNAPIYVMPEMAQLHSNTQTGPKEIEDRYGPADPPAVIRKALAACLAVLGGEAAMMGMFLKDDLKITVMIGSVQWEGKGLRFKEDSFAQIDGAGWFEAHIGDTVLGRGRSFILAVPAGALVEFRPMKSSREKFSAEEIEAARKSKTVLVVWQEEFEKGEFVFDGMLDEVIASLARIRERVPEEYRALARCEIDSDVECDNPPARIKITYCRPEIDEEVTKRLQSELIQNEMREREGRAVLARLEKKIRH